ncbi:hypothetical protein MAIT1_02504 [Magnetofaba australis IT-1]|uniref:Uncharacterized protein n=1 Tax=Magnetofaba australis IT-1 TaxID=1434232 RepID=A0A1Y2K2V2_9PROT|nr:hypothetical protein MAIT1_02504 [Magnetofaba australis IT-1]
MGIFRLRPQVTINYAYDDNVYKTASNKVSDQKVTITPVLQAVTHWKKVTMTASLSSTITKHLKEEQEDFDDHVLTVGAKFSPSKRLEFDVDGQLAYKHDSRGTAAASSLSVSESPEQWLHYSGSVKAQYTLNRIRTIVSAQHSVDDKSTYGKYWNDVSLGMMFALAPKTSIVTEGTWRRYVYDDAYASRDGDEHGVMAGMTWAGFGQTSGSLTAGWKGKSYSNGAIADKNAYVMSGEVQWNPRKRTNLSLSLSRDFEEGDATDSYYISTTGDLALNHKLRSFLNLSANVGYSIDDYMAGQQDDTLSSGIGLSYDFKRWLTLSADYSYKQKNSSVATSDYSSNEYMLKLSSGL